MDQQVKLQHGAFSWNELLTTDVAAAKAFYGTLFGWDMHDEQGCGVPYTVLKAGEREVGGIMAVPPEVEGMPPAWGSYVTVDDVDERVAAAERLGGKLVVPPRDIPGIGRFAVITDPQGAALALIAYTRQG
jgi:predicted enzyme related to lactoylglutathione lyase